MREASVALCADFSRAETECFGPWCVLFDGGGDASPAAARASQAGLHEAAGRLRAWCLADPGRADAERRELMTRQAEGELATAAAVQARRSAVDRDRIRAGWVTARWSIICQRDALTCGLGWPHRGELVTVATWQRDADGRRAAVTGEGIYLGGFDVFEVSHQVWLPARGSRRRGTVLVRWAARGDEDGPLGPADPAGDIGLRLADAPGRRLPVPLMRWPGPAGVGIQVPAPARSATQPALFEAGEVPGPPGGRSSRNRPRPHRRKVPAAAAAGTQTLF